MNKIIITPICLLGGCLLLSPNPVYSRTTSISGSLGGEQEYTSNVFHENSNESTQWTSTLLPTLTVVSEGSKDSMQFTASSELLWNQRIDDRDFSHDLAFTGTKEISQHLQLTVSDEYSYYDKHARQDFDAGLSLSERFQRANRFDQEEVFRLLFPDYQEEYDPQDHYTLVLSEIDTRYNLASPSVQNQVDGYLSNSDFRPRYWTNEFTIGTEYEFARDSILSLGYSYDTLDDRTAQVTEYYEHRPSLGISYRFNSMWQASLDYEFTRTQYDQEDDFTGNDTTVTVDYNVGPADQFNFTYEYLSSRYDGDRSDLAEQIGELGWDHHFTNQIHLSSTVDANYLKREVAGDEHGVGFRVDLTRDLSRGSVAVGGGGEYDQIKRSGSWRDIRGSWSVDGAVSYTLMQDLAATFDVAYEKRYEWPLVASNATYDDYETGISLSYTFFRWYTVSLGYTFNKLDAHSSPVSDYLEHTVMLSLFAAKDLFRW